MNKGDSPNKARQGGMEKALLLFILYKDKPENATETHPPRPKLFQI